MRYQTGTRASFTLALAPAYPHLEPHRSIITMLNVFPTNYFLHFSFYERICNYLIKFLYLKRERKYKCNTMKCKHIFMIRIYVHMCFMSVTAHALVLKKKRSPSKGHITNSHSIHLIIHVCNQASMAESAHSAYTPNTLIGNLSTPWGFVCWFEAQPVSKSSGSSWKGPKSYGAAEARNRERKQERGERYTVGPCIKDITQLGRLN